MNDLKNVIDGWIYFIKNAENLNVIPENIKDEGLYEAYNQADKHSWTKQELEAYEKQEIRRRDDIGKLELAEKKGKIEGEKLGLKKGIQKGKIEGEQIGIQKGIKEGKIKIAKKMILKGLDDESISEITELSLKEIKNLRTEK